MSIRILITDDHVTIARTGCILSFTTAPPADMNTIERAQLMAHNFPGQGDWIWEFENITIEHGHDLYSTLVLGILVGRFEDGRITSLPVGGN
jgi:hypothetical protein